MKMFGLLSATGSGGINLSNISLSADDILLAAVLALFLTWLIQSGSRMFRLSISKPAEFDYRQKDFNRLMSRCCLLFPNDSVQFHGKVFKRGTAIRITTIQKKTIEGKFVGINSDNMLCMITTRHVVAQEIDSILEIVDMGM